MNRNAVAFGIAAFVLTALAANEKTAQQIAEQDHQRLMDLLHISAIRSGADPNHPQAPNAVNYDEAKANPWPNLPDPLLLNNGKKVTTAAEWWNLRRPEIVEAFDREVYGRVPANVPEVTWDVVSSTKQRNAGVPVLVEEVAGHVDNSGDLAIGVDIALTVTTPADATHPVPVVLALSFDPALMKRFLDQAKARGMKLPTPAPGDPGGPGPTWQQQLLAKGWGYAILIPTDIQPDNGAGLTEGIIGLTNRGEPREPDQWGALRAWAWGASRALDYLETDDAVDARHVAIEGLSRYGKAALVAMAYDQRFAFGFIGSSGMGGANLWRRNCGERLENLAGTGEYHWMAGNFLRYAGPLTANDLPVDSHELIALCAPRPVFISAGSPPGDQWVDPRGMFMAEVAAGPVYRLLGARDLGTTQMPPVGTAIIQGNLAFRQHTFGHTTGPNWPTFLEWAQHR